MLKMDDAMKKALLLIGLVTVMVCGGWAYTSWSNYFAACRTESKTAEYNADLGDLFTALQKYKEVVGSYPVGNNLEVAKALLGDNPKGLIIIVGHKQNVNAKGEFIDPWGTPLRIYFSGDGILIRSAGPNKRFDDSTVQNSDDYYRSN